MASIDERIVQMQFDNKQFENGVNTTLSSLEKLKKGLNLKDSSKSFDEINKKAKETDLSGIQKAVEAVKERFSSLGIVGITILQNITNAAWNAGTALAKSITIQPIIDGLHEYETQINAVQTILANTQKEHTNIDQVNKSLDVLNAYADKTIYNFTEMTRNIGTFTAAGVDLQTSVDSIQGISNLAAVSGSTSVQASTAMYQLSQAIASGTVKLMDWNSVVNAGMGGQVFQDALIRTSEHLKTGAKAAIEAKGSFRESLQTGWLTTEVLTETLKQFSLNVESAEDYEKAMADLVSQGYTQEEAKNIVDMARTASEAATKVKTFSQLIDTLKEAIGSGWAQSWRTIIGDFEEAKQLWTTVSDVLSGYINESANARNEMLQGWADMGGRQAVIDGLSKAFDNLVKIISAVSKSFRDIFPKTTSDQLVNLSNGFKELTERMEPSEQTLDRISRVAKGLFSALDLLKQALMSILKPIGDFLGSEGVGGFSGSILEVVACFGDFITALDEGAKAGDIFGSVASTIGAVLNSVSGVLGVASAGFTAFGDIIKSITEAVSGLVGGGLSWISENLGLGDIGALLAGGGIVAIAKNFDAFTDAIKKFLDTFGKGFKGSIDIIDSLKKSLTSFFTELGTALQAFTMMVNTVSLVAIAGAVAILVKSIQTLTSLDFGLVVSNIPVVAALMFVLTKGFKTFVKAIKAFNPKGVIKASIAMIALAEAIKILAEAIAIIGNLGIEGAITGLGAIMALMVAISLFIEKSNLSSASLKGSVALIAIGTAMKVMASAVKDLGSMSINDLVKGIAAMGAAMAELTLVQIALSKFSGGKGLVGALSLVILVQTLKPIADALTQLGSLSVEQTVVGLYAMTAALGEMLLIDIALQKFSGGKGLVGALSLVILVQTLKPIADALTQLGSLSPEQLLVGLIGIGAALGELVLITTLMGALSPLSGLIASIGLLVAVQALKPIADALTQLGNLTWEQVAIGLVAMGLALTELAVITGLLGTLAPLGAILGAGAILLGVQGLGQLADALQKFGSMTWEQVAIGLVAMGAALTELAVITGLLGTLAPLAALVGAGSILLAIQGLDQLASALQRFGSMSWDEIGRGLTAMGTAMAEVAGGSFLNTLSGIGAGAIQTAADGLNTLADALQKWKDVSVPENLPSQLGTLANGIMAFTFGGIGAGTLNTASSGLKSMAEAISAWQGVSVPDNLESGLKSLAQGIQAFSFAAIGGFTIDAVKGPLQGLADSVRAWDGVTIPEGIKDGLSNLAQGCQAFTFSGFGAGGMETVQGPLRLLADAVKNWQGVSIPEGIKDGLVNLADGAKSLSTVNGEGLSSCVWGLGEIGNAVNGINNSNPIGAGQALQSFGNSIVNIPTQISGVAAAVSVSMGTIASAISSSARRFQAAGNTAAMALGTGLSVGMIIAGSTGAGAARTAAMLVITSGTVALNAGQFQFMIAGKNMIDGIRQGVEMGKPSTVSAIRNVVTACKEAVSSGNSEFHSAGSYMAQGLASGIRSGRSEAVNAAKEIAKAAVDAAKQEAVINSPSRKFIEIGGYMSKGMVIGLLSLKKKVELAGSDIAATAVNAASAQSKVNITPIVTSDNAGVIRGLTSNKSISLSAKLAKSNIINPVTAMQRAMSLENSEVIQSNDMVVQAIDGLRNDMNSYTDAVIGMENAVYVDGRKLASSIAKPMNQQLGIMTKRGSLA